MKKYKVTLTEEQLMLIAQCVEDCHRFACGQTELDNTINVLCSPHKFMIKERLKLLQKFVNPDLLPNQSYDWTGSGCKDEQQKNFIAKTYAIYREILHKVINDGVYKSPTLTCKEGGQVPIIEVIEEESTYHKDMIEAQRIYDEEYSKGEYCHNQSFIWGFETGCNYKESGLLEKACEWLRTRNVLTEENLEEFRKAMEEEL